MLCCYRRTRGIGYKFSEYLALNSPLCTLIIVGRSKIPPKNEWDSYLRSEEINNFTKKINKIKELESYGVTVIYISADVSTNLGVKKLKKLREGIIKILKGFFMQLVLQVILFCKIKV